MTPILDLARQAQRQEANDRYGVVNSGTYDGRGLVLLDACHLGATTLDRSAKAVDRIYSNGRGIHRSRRRELARKGLSANRKRTIASMAKNAALVQIGSTEHART